MPWLIKCNATGRVRRTAPNKEEAEAYKELLDRERDENTNSETPKCHHTIEWVRDGW